MVIAHRCTCPLQATHSHMHINLLGGMNLDRVSVWKQYIYLPSRVHHDIRLMTFKCTPEHTPTGQSPAPACSRADGRCQSMYIAECAAICDVDKLAEHRWHLAVGWKRRRISSVVTDHWLWLIDSTTDIVHWRFWTCTNNWYSSTPQRR